MALPKVIYKIIFKKGRQIKEAIERVKKEKAEKEKAEKRQDEEASDILNGVPPPEDEAGAIERVTPVVRVVPDPVPEQEVLSAKEYDEGGKPPQKVSPDDDSSKSETPEDQAFGTDHESGNTVNIPGQSDTSNEDELEVETGSS
jgi:hypothetical protein